MIALVIDASAAASWLIETQATASSDAFLEARADDDFIAPAIFAWEIVNLIASKSGRGSLDLDHGLEALGGLGIKVRPPLPGHEVVKLAPFAIEVGLSLFDAAYLALAIESGGAIVSRDKALLDAAVAHGIQIFDLRDKI